MIDDVQRAAEDRRGLWALHDEAGRLDQQISDAIRNAPAGVSNHPVPGDAPDELLSYARQALEEALAAEREAAAQNERIAKAEAAITAIEDQQARRRQQLIGAAMALAAALLVLLAVWLSG